MQESRNSMRVAIVWKFVLFSGMIDGVWGCLVQVRALQAVKLAYGAVFNKGS